MSSVHSSRRMGSSWTRNIFGVSFFRPSGACVVSVLYPRLAPWAAFFRRLAALKFHANLDARQACDLLPRNKRAAFARRADLHSRNVRENDCAVRPGPSFAQKACSLRMTTGFGDHDAVFGGARHAAEFGRTQ